MIKTMYRTLMILLAAGLVSGAIYWFSTTSAGQAAFGMGGEHGMRFARGGAPDASGLPATGGRQNFRRRPESGGELQPFGGERAERSGHTQVDLARGLAGLGDELVKLAVITLVIVLGRKLVSALMRKFRRPAPLPTP